MVDSIPASLLRDSLGGHITQVFEALAPVNGEERNSFCMSLLGLPLQSATNLVA